MRRENCVTGFFLCAWCLILVFSKPALAKNALIEKLDLDKDGHITLRESVVEPQILATFGTIDCNNDGKISKTELKKAQISIVQKVSTLKSA
ncbi:MAG: hypothetical protein ABJH06_10075 [Paraglaciecola sp.]|uniref:hypothetical protein n=1 Tax=Paraglaciecola sp. TaxID=1920173 RepID=UPI0032666498